MDSVVGVITLPQHFFVVIIATYLIFIICIITMNFEINL